MLASCKKINKKRLLMRLTRMIIEESIEYNLGPIFRQIDNRWILPVVWFILGDEFTVILKLREAFFEFIFHFMNYFILLILRNDKLELRLVVKPLWIWIRSCIIILHQQVVPYFRNDDCFNMYTIFLICCNTL